MQTEGILLLEPKVVCSTIEYVATYYSMGSCGCTERGLCFTIVETRWTVTLVGK
jgi:hypothetical protein